jgi:hypothetical protein
MAQEYPTPTPLETPKRRSNTGLLIGLLVILVLCCVCVVFPLILYFWLGDILLEFFRSAMAPGSVSLIALAF